MSNLLDQASIILTATSYDVSKVLCVKPSAAPYGDFDFSRATEASRINSSGLIETVGINIPRINYENGCGSLLFEPQSTNLITQSELFSDASWTKIATTVSSNSTTSPSGGINASTIVSTNATSEQYLDVGGLSVTSGDSYNLCCFVKKKDYDYFLIRFTGVGGAFVASNAFFDINNGTLGTVDSGLVGSITDYGNGWYRCSATIVASATTVSGKVRLQLASSDNSEAIVGDGTSGTFVWGTQFEAQSYSTSYIPTEGTTKTRNQDLCTNGGDVSLISSTEGTLYAEIAALADDLTFRSISLSDGSTNNVVTIRYRTNSNRIQVFVFSGGVLQFSKSFDVTNILDFNKVAISYNQSDFNYWVNGVKRENSTSGNTPIGMNKLSFDAGGGSYPFFGKTKCLAVWKESLSDTELTELTTI